MGAEQFPLNPKGAGEAQKAYTALENREDQLLAAVASGNFDEAKRLKEELETGITNLSERLVSPLERELKLREQYESQQKLWQNSGLLQKMAEQGHRFPEYAQVRAAIRDQQETLSPKAEQGFRKLVIVPFSLPIPDLCATYGEAIKRHKAAGTLKGANGDDLDLDTTTPVWRWDGYDKEQVVYFPEKFDKTKHNGKTKEQVIASQGAWQVKLLEDGEIPREGAGAELGTSTNKRKQLEANKKPNEYLPMLGIGQYANEQGLTPEAWLALAITRLQETDTVLDDYDGGGSACYNLGAYFPASDRVSYCYWYRGYQRTYVGRGYPVLHDPRNGVRSSVRVELRT